jgi:cellulose synthase/poly-beta-1,6-N-acetylglucosamine synthase-like glycosyltransferase
MLAALEIVIPALYAVAIVVLTAYGGNLLWLSLVHATTETLRDGPVPDPDALPTPDDSWPVVTVQLPLYNEAEVARRLIDACVALDYPQDRLEIQVLDDSTDATTERVARRVAYWQERGVDITHAPATRPAPSPTGCGWREETTWRSSTPTLCPTPSSCGG